MVFKNSCDLPWESQPFAVRTVPGVVPSQVQLPVLILVELHEVFVSKLPQPVRIPLDGCMSPW